MKKNFLSAVVILTFFFIVPVHAEEKINYFDTNLYINQDGSLDVVESISVQAENIDINHGIYRDIPTTYKDRFGHTYNTNFTLTSVRQDGEPQDYHTQKMSNGIRIYIGKEDEYVSPGEHMYELQYTVHRVLGFFSDHDELYWNVTGDEWKFPIEKATAWVIIPPYVARDSLRLQAFTGAKGSTEAGYTVDTYEETGSSGPLFQTNRRLEVGEGFTIVAGWEPGYIHRPTPKEKFILFLFDNRNVLLGVVGIFLLFLYYWYAWIRVGRDPEKSTIIAQYEPPKDMSPAKIRYLMKMKFDDGVFISQLIDMASRGLMTIAEDKNKYTFALVENSRQSVSKEDELILNHFFGKKEHTRRASITIDTASSSDTTGDIIVRGTKKALTNFLDKEMNKKFFHLNRKFLWVGIGISLIVLLIAGSSSVESLFSVAWLGIWSIGVVTLLSQAAKFWKPIMQSENISLTQFSTALSSTLFAFIFLAAELIVCFFVFSEISLVFFIIFVILLGMNILFYRILPRLTPEGRQLMDYLEGFKWFLSVTEKDRLHFFHPPHKTPELFHSYLSYAFALGVEQAWAEQFTSIFAAQKNNNGQPSWFHSSSLRTWSPTSFVHSVSTASSSISAASQPPSSRSGFSGGSSGGGGGGGGGGGW